VLSFPFPLRFLFASRPKIMGKVLGIVYRVLATHLIHKAGFTHATAKTGAKEGIPAFLEKRKANFEEKASSDMPDFYPWWD
jgi:hypothetical protein